MQLIFETDPESCITTNMALINKDSINEKFSDNIVEKLSNSIPNGNKENIEEHDNLDAENSLTTVDTSKNEELKDKRKKCELDNDISDATQESSHNLDNNIEQIENICSPRQSETDLKSIEDQIDCVGKEMHVENGTNEAIDNSTVESNKENDLNESEIPLNKSTEASLEGINQPSIESNLLDEDDKEKDLSSSLKNHSSDERNVDRDGVKTSESNTLCENMSEKQEENTLNVTSNDMDVDEKDEILGKENHKDDFQVINSVKDESIETPHKENSLQPPIEENVLDKKDLLKDEITKTHDPQHSTETLKTDKSEQGNDGLFNNVEDKGTVVCEIGLNNKSALNNSKVKTVNTSCTDETKIQQILNSTTEETPKKPRKSKITLDILSDDEETPLEVINNDDVTNETNKQCINIEDDDDDIMLIDESSTIAEEKVDATVLESKSVEDQACYEKEESVVEDKKCVKNIDITTTVIKDSPNYEETTDVNKLDEDIKEEKAKSDEPQSQPKPLLPKNFVSTCKKNLAEMTRNDLEEFCILKIVESVVDRGNLGEIKTQLKRMARNIEEFKNKTKVLTKQNHALQVVIKSVQEELSNNTNKPIIPLKISRSVGVQVQLPEIKRKCMNPITGTGNNGGNTSPVNKTLRTPPPLVTRSTKAETVGQQIPVPRLVPASSGVKSNTSSPNQTLNKTVPTAVPASKTPLTKKPTKRPSAAKMVNSDTVDLTDDEPPPKVTVRAGNRVDQVRVVPSHNLMAPQRAPLGTVVNHPRQVYIPISGGQAQNVRPGQTFMLRAINSQNIRPRNPSMNKEPYRRASISTHPAPLPEIAKQCQPPNWKLLPPAPEIKLSKVENGIVISWKLDNYHEENHEIIANYQIYAYQETLSPPNTNLWKKIGDVKALPLPMACTLTQFMSGYKYYFAVRAVDIRSRIGPFSSPGNIMLLNK